MRKIGPEGTQPPIPAPAKEMTLDEVVDRCPPKHRARAELATLRAENKELRKLRSVLKSDLLNLDLELDGEKTQEVADWIENEMATALAFLRAENAAQAKQIETMRDVVRLAADMIPETDEHILATMARTTAIVAQSVLSSTVAAVTTDTLQRAASRACDVMSECVEHSECSGADRAEMKAAKQQLLDALLGKAIRDAEREKPEAWGSGAVIPA